MLDAAWTKLRNNLLGNSTHGNVARAFTASLRKTKTMFDDITRKYGLPVMAFHHVLQGAFQSVAKLPPSPFQLPWPSDSPEQAIFTPDRLPLCKRQSSTLSLFMLDHRSKPLPASDQRTRHL
eukprot:TRINITY_DN6629_c0_g1_i1.p1 TRINITY_DN6629_c0_g1~~TRINITY_DN6629_c0_g1_i1.p1  ORF type:complete len:122 (+),score=13.55 TRINITY_DN6629_c0_g1_i1:290-655(+)